MYVDTMLHVASHRLPVSVVGCSEEEEMCRVRAWVQEIESDDATRDREPAPIPHDANMLSSLSLVVITIERSILIVTT
jgi:hypothetical protein